MFRFTRRLGICVAALVVSVVAYSYSAPKPLPLQDRKAQGSVMGYVATVLRPQVLESVSVRSNLIGPQGVSIGEPIFLPDISVVAKNERGFTSKTAVTNPQGYFVITDLPEDRYEICVSGTGYTTRCDDRRITVNHFPSEVDHPVLIFPGANAIAGTVWLADRTTPCFWFRPAIDPHALTAKVSLVDGNQNVVAGPVFGNNIGQYVLPTLLGSGSGNVHAVCDAGIADVAVKLHPGPALQDVAINNHAPKILSMDFSKGSSGVRRVNPGDVVRVTVQATDLDGDPLHYQWVDDSGRNLGLPDAPSVDWPVLSVATFNTLHIQVSDGRGGIATLSRSLQAGPDALVFAGHVFDRQTLAPVNGAAVSLNKVATKTDPSGNFRITVPDAGQFVLNVTKPGFALASLIFRTRATNIEVPLDAVQTSIINAGAGGSIQIPPPGCQCRCEEPHHGPRQVGKQKEGHDYDKDDHDKDHDNGCGKGGSGSLSVQFPPGALVDAKGAAYNGAASIEGFQYDLTKQNPIPGDFGAVYQGKAVRMASFGAFHILARDAQGHPLKMAVAKQVSVSAPIQISQQNLAPPVIPFFHYDEDSGTWLEDGTLTRSGNRYVGHIAHFSAFNADTIFPGGACVKVVLDNSFVLPVTLDASYFDPSAGTFNHNGTQSNDVIIGVERMAPFQNFTLNIIDSNNPPAQVSVPLFSGPGLDPVQFPAGLDTDQVNFSHCNGPVQISNNTIPATQPYFLGKVFGGSITDNSVNYRTVTDANPGGSRDTLDHWKSANNFPSGEATAIYFNNGDLKFGRDMHCRVTNAVTNALACYVSNFGIVGTDDAITALQAAEQYEASGQTAPAPGATVTMEYDPVKGVQFWAYKTDGSYFISPPPALDSQGPKTMPDICMGCHQGTYNGSTTQGVVGAVFLPFDLDSFKDDTNQLFPAHQPSAALQTQFHALNNMVANTSPPAAVTQLINQLWYSTTNTTVPFTFNQGAAQLPSQPFIDSQGHHHEPLYDNVVKQVCRTCHVAIDPFPWNAFTLNGGVSGMNNVPAGTFQVFACAPQKNMPNAQVPWINFWQQNKSATLASELNFGGVGCPNQ